MSEKILLVRRDNIGDLVLTTPLISALRAHKPDAWIGFLANSYNVEVLAGNSRLDAVFAYDKAKHRPDRIRLAVYWETAKLLLELRALHIDTVVLAGPGAQRQAYSLAKWIKPGRIVGFVTPDFSPSSITDPIPWGSGAELTETEDVFRLLGPLGIRGDIPPCEVFPDKAAVEAIAPAVRRHLEAARQPWVGIQISARRPSQRWPIDRFAALMREIHASTGCGFVLFWAPGSSENVQHPGDDEAARALVAMLPQGFPVYPCATSKVSELIAGLSLVDSVVTPDGGAMHLAAGLQKPIVALFGDSPVQRWRPWGVVNECLGSPEGDVAYIEVASVLSAWSRLTKRVGSASI